MKNTIIIIVLSLLMGYSCNERRSDSTSATEKVSSTMSKKAKGFAIVIHGGAGSLKKGDITTEQEEIYRKKLQEALDLGYNILEKGGSALDAVENAIVVLEDSPLFNAGKGAVFNSSGNHELDASIMDGKTLNTGAVAGVSLVKNPINAARVVMDCTRHVLMAGKGAEDFAKLKGVGFVDHDYFYTEDMYKALMNAKQEEKNKKNHISEIPNKKSNVHKYGTVGAVALDKKGNIASATSTGGLTNKKYGRIGDSPIVGAGTYANNLTCGVSATGVGEYFIRTLASHEVSSLIQYKNLPLLSALDDVIKQIGTLGGVGGLIGLDKNGNVAWSFNTPGMFRGYKKSNGENVVKFYKEQ